MEIKYRNKKKYIWERGIGKFFLNKMFFFYYENRRFLW